MQGQKIQMQLSHTVASTKVLGPGNRYVIWTQGCEKRCRNCINPMGQSLDGGYSRSVGQIVDDIKAQDGRSGINGVTISGGEPFLQLEGLKGLVAQIKAETDCDIMLYSGYRLQEIIARMGQEEAWKFFSNIDIFIDGEYMDGLDSGSIYRGSDNQQIYFFTDKYSGFRSKIYDTKNRDIEFGFDKDGQVVIVGLPPKGFYGEFIKKIGDIRE